MLAAYQAGKPLSFVSQVYERQGIAESDSQRQRAPTPVMQTFMQEYSSAGQAQVRKRMPMSSVKSKCNEDLENISKEDSSNFSEPSDAQSKKAIKQLDLTKAKAPVITQTHKPQPKDKIRKSVASSSSKLSKKMQTDHTKFQSKVV